MILIRELLQHADLYEIIEPYIRTFINSTISSSVHATTQDGKIVHGLKCDLQKVTRNDENGIPFTDSYVTCRHVGDIAICENGIPFTDSYVTNVPTGQSDEIFGSTSMRERAEKTYKTVSTHQKHCGLKDSEA